MNVETVQPEHSFADLLDNIRNYWTELDLDDARQYCEALSVLQGYAERLTEEQKSDPSNFQFFREEFSLLQHQQTNALAIENKVSELGLSLCQSRGSLLKVEVWFGVVESISGDKARVILLDQDDLHVLVDHDVPLDWLLENYRESGAGVAWVERSYSDGKGTGRFEPGSTAE